MACGKVVGFVGLDELSLKMASSLIRHGYAPQAFEVGSFSLSLSLFLFLSHSNHNSRSTFWLILVNILLIIGNLENKCILSS